MLKQQIVTGVAAGLVATVSYDLSRFALIKLTGIHGLTLRIGEWVTS